MKRDLEEILSRLAALDLVRSFEKKRILITGARGFLGQAFVRVFSELGNEVIALDRYTLASELGASPPEQLRGVEHVDWDVIESEPPTYGPIHYVLSLAAIASPVHYARRPLDCFDVIVNGTRNMAELSARKGATMLLSSTSELYGDPIVVPSPENTIGRLDPWSVRGKAYDVPKLAAEALVAIFREMALKIQTVRYFNVYGNGLAEGDYRIMSKFASAVVRQVPLKVYGYGSQTRSFCYLTDAIVGTLLVLARGDGVPYNVGNPEEVSVHALAEIFAKIGNLTIEKHEAPKEYVEEPRRRCPDIARIASLGFTPSVPLREGVERLVTWAKEAYQQNPAPVSGYIHTSRQSR